MLNLVGLMDMVAEASLLPLFTRPNNTLHVTGLPTPYCTTIQLGLDLYYNIIEERCTFDMQAICPTCVEYSD